jgi:hypothetical protein
MFGAPLPKKETDWSAFLRRGAGSLYCRGRVVYRGDKGRTPEAEEVVGGGHAEHYAHITGLPSAVSWRIHPLLPDWY